MAVVFYSYIVNDVILQNPEILQKNQKKQVENKERKKPNKLHFGTKLSYFKEMLKKGPHIIINFLFGPGSLDCVMKIKTLLLNYIAVMP